MQNDNNEFYEEVKEDVRNDQLLKLWKQYSQYIYIGIAAIIIFVGGNGAWKYYKANERYKFSDLYMNALHHVENQQVTEAIEILNKIENDASNDNTYGYRILAKFQKANILLHTSPKSQISEKALEIYKNIFEDKSIESNYRDLAIYLYALNSLDFEPQHFSAEELKKKVETLIMPGNTYYHLGLEILAYMEFKQKNFLQAQSYLKQLISEEDKVSGDIIDRAKALLIKVNSELENQSKENK